jgi:hypothetical protein
MIDPDRVAPEFDLERAARQAGLELPDQRFGLDIRYRAAKLDSRVVHHATRIANHRAVLGLEQLLDVISQGFEPSNRNRKNGMWFKLQIPEIDQIGGARGVEHKQE